MTYRFGAFAFDGTANLLRRSGRDVPLEPQPGRALAHLLAHADEVVSKEDLRRAVWGDDTHVDFDRGLAYCLSQIRAALGDSGENPRFIQTLPRRGYRFIAPVQRDAPAVTSSPDDPVERPTSGSDLPLPEASRQTAQRSWKWAALAVLATGAVVAGLWSVTRARDLNQSRVIVAVSIFDNETGVAEHDRLVAGLSDLVVTRLTALAPDRIGVIGNAAVLRQPRNIRNLKAVMQGVRADFVVLGQLQRADAGMRFITHLIRLSDETHLRANRIQMPDGNLSGLETAVVDEFERAVREHVLR